VKSSARIPPAHRPVISAVVASTRPKARSRTPRTRPRHPYRPQQEVEARACVQPDTPEHPEGEHAHSPHHRATGPTASRVRLQPPWASRIRLQPPRPSRHVGAVRLARSGTAYRLGCERARHGGAARRVQPHLDGGCRTYTSSGDRRAARLLCFTATTSPAPTEQRCAILGQSSHVGRSHEAGEIGAERSRLRRGCLRRKGAASRTRSWRCSDG